MNNWQRLNLPSMEEGIMYVLHFLKSQEEKIMTRSVSDDTTIICGDIILTLNRKKLKKKK